MRRALASLLLPAFYQSFVLERIDLVHNFRRHFVHGDNAAGNKMLNIPFVSP